MEILLHKFKKFIGTLVFKAKRVLVDLNVLMMTQ